MKKVWDRLPPKDALPQAAGAMLAKPVNRFDFLGVDKAALAEVDKFVTGRKAVLAAEGVVARDCPGDELPPFKTMCGYRVLHALEDALSPPALRALDRAERPDRGEDFSDRLMDRLLGFGEAMSWHDRLDHAQRNSARVDERLVWLLRVMVARGVERVADVKALMPDMSVRSVLMMEGRGRAQKGQRLSVEFMPLDGLGLRDVRSLKTVARAPVATGHGLAKQLSDQSEELLGLRAKVVALSSSIDALRAEWQRLADVSERRRLSALRYEQDLESLRRQLREALSVQVAGVVPAAAEEVRFPDTWDGLEDFAARYLAPHVVLTQKAVRAARGSLFENVPFAFEVLLMLAADYVPMRRGEVGARERFEAAVMRLRVDVSMTGESVEVWKLKGSYSVLFEGERYPLDLHVRGSSSRDPRQGFRVYFHYREEDDCLIVGSFPSHLENRSS